MNGDKRLASEDLVEELRSALDADSGWIPALAGSEGPAGVTTGAALDAVVARLWEFVEAPTTPERVARQLARAAEAADAALVTEGAARYGALGAAYAYVLQARQAANG
ncbi:hypothetical protein [Streptomyces sp. SID10815]|uniref:hypothetical protein n=1 Tax=Streptomyces sp. SID10815 TaxID=2706027 RepID=UPI0013C88219|nr:hypothetical protein [Streptomyces sp. SID10815]NEA46843.1 hypothetical protein [Streptomyces sp. SID10815]